MTGKIINSVGLVFDMIGACFVAWEVVKQYKGKKYISHDSYHSIGSISDDKSPTDTPEFMKYEQEKYKYMKVGLILLLFGFALQIVSNWVN
ncbi:MAG: hypothetical protein H8D23_21560 [Candidatus Brocadiales bacterium]|nr:hypothetical protein [Candidatus Brocadiales bacterium]